MGFPGEAWRRVSFYVRQPVHGIFCCEALQVHSSHTLQALASFSIQLSFEMLQVMNIVNILIERMGPVSGKRLPN